MDIKDLIVRYGLVFPKRFYPKEKLLFLRGLAKEFIGAGMSVDIKEVKKNQRKAYNLYAGNVNQAGLTVSAYYDTPPKTFSLVKHKAYCPKGDGIEFLISILAPYLIIIAIAAVLSHFVLMPIWSDNIFNYLDALAFLPLVILFPLLMYFRNGVGNKPNLVRNSAALIACVKLAEDLKPKERNKISLAFTDYGCINHYGDRMLKEFLAEKADANTVILLDCVGGQGDVIVLYSAACAGFVEKVKANFAGKAVFYEMKENDPRYYQLFNKSIVITSGKLANGAATAEKVNSSKDNDINEENLNAAIGVIKDFVRNY